MKVYPEFLISEYKKMDQDPNAEMNEFLDAYFIPLCEALIEARKVARIAAVRSAARGVPKLSELKLVRETIALWPKESEDVE